MTVVSIVLNDGSGDLEPESFDLVAVPRPGDPLRIDGERYAIISVVHELNRAKLGPSVYDGPTPRTPAWHGITIYANRVD